jgi:hypothetical protein
MPTTAVDDVLEQRTFFSAVEGMTPLRKIMTESGQ